jgi:hypothetical protein
MHYVNQAATCTQNGRMSHNGLVLVEHNNARTSCVCIATPPNCYRDLRVSLMLLCYHSNDVSLAELCSPYRANDTAKPTEEH